MKPTVRVQLVMDQEILRDGMRALLETSPDVLVVGDDAEVGSSPDELVARAWPDVVLVHENLRRGDGLAAAAAIVERHGDGVGVIMLASSPDPVRIDRAVRLGVRGYLLEDDETWLLTAGIRAVATKLAWWSPRATDVLLAEYRRGAMPGAEQRDRSAADLTLRERSVVRLVALGRSNAEIAHELVLGHATIKSHVSRILTKLELRDRTQLAAYAYRNGLVTPE